MPGIFLGIRLCQVNHLVKRTAMRKIRKIQLPSTAVQIRAEHHLSAGSAAMHSLMSRWCGLVDVEDQWPAFTHLVWRHGSTATARAQTLKHLIALCANQGMVGVSCGQDPRRWLCSFPEALRSTLQEQQWRQPASYSLGHCWCNITPHLQEACKTSCRAPSKWKRIQQELALHGQSR